MAAQLGGGEGCQRATHMVTYLFISFFSQQARRRDVCFEEWYHPELLLTGVQMVDFSWAPSLASLWVSVWRSLAPGDIGEWTEGMEMIFHDMICIYVYISTYTVHV